MFRYSLIIILYCTLSLPSLLAQDIHYSQFFNSPLNLSPSMTGYFNGESRYQLNYRNQWASVPVDYVSATASADYKFRNIKNDNYYAAGIMINYDMAGDLNLNLTDITATFAYSFELNETSRFSPAVAVSFAQRRFDPDDIRTGNQWDGRAYNPTIPAEDLGANSRNYFDLGAGLNYRWQKAFRNFFDVGASAFHIIKPTESFDPDVDYDAPRPMRYSIYALFNFPVANRLDILLNGMYTGQEEYRERVVNTQLKFYVGSKQSAAFYLGGGYRLDDAWYPMVAIEMGAVYGAFSYDFTISDFETVTDGRGGPEFTLRYIVARIPKGENKPCPLY